MSSLKLKDDAGNWVCLGGSAVDTDLTWTDINQSTFYISATGGNYHITTANDQGYVFGILPATPANGTIVRVQVADAINSAYLQPTGTDTIEFQVAAVLAKNNAQLVEAVRYYNGRWLRIDGNYPYAAPPLVGPYLVTTTTAAVYESIVSSSQTITSSSGYSIEAICSPIFIHISSSSGYSIEAICSPIFIHIY
jgi:hypothetical protein